MKPKKRQKLCQNCEGDVDLEVIVCPYCAADLREEKPEKERSSYRAPVSQGASFDSLYPSPHAAKAPPLSEETARPAPMQAAVMEEEETGKGALLPIFLLTLGIQLLVLGLLTVFCSHQGVVVLKWSARFWFVYLFGAIPLLVFGYKAVSKL